MISGNEPGFKKISTVNRRMFIFSAAKAIIFFGIVGRLFSLQISESKKYLTLSDKNRLREWRLPPVRGEFLDYFGNTIAGNLKVYQLHVVPDQVEDFKYLMVRLKDILELSNKELNDLIKQLQIYGVDRSPEGLDKLYNDVAVLEDACILMNMKDYIPTIKKTVEQYKTRESIHSDSNKLIDKAHRIMVDNGDQLVACRSRDNEISMKIKELFNVNNIEDLCNILDKSSQKIPSIKSTSDRIEKFKNSFKGAIAESKKGKLNNPTPPNEKK